MGWDGMGLNMHEGTHHAFVYAEHFHDKVKRQHKLVLIDVVECAQLHVESGLIYGVLQTDAKAAGEIRIQNMPATPRKQREYVQIPHTHSCYKMPLVTSVYYSFYGRLSRRSSSVGTCISRSRSSCFRSLLIALGCVAIRLHLVSSPSFQ